jgi:hypothetical protein
VVSVGGEECRLEDDAGTQGNEGLQNVDDAAIVDALGGIALWSPPERCTKTTASMSRTASPRLASSSKVSHDDLGIGQ